MGGETTSLVPKRSIYFADFRGGDWSNWDGTYANVPAPTAEKFVAKLNKIVSDAGFADRIDVCTSLQWERAARAGTRGDSFFPSGSGNDFTWNNGNSGGWAHSVGSKKPNAWGLYDVYGNATEISLDGEVYSAQTESSKDYMVQNGSIHMGCAGTFVNGFGTMTSGYRFYAQHDGGIYGGYRLIIRSGKW